MDDATETQGRLKQREAESPPQVKVMHLPSGLKTRFGFVIVIFIVIIIITQGAHRMSDVRDKTSQAIPRGP